MPGGITLGPRMNWYWATLSLERLLPAILMKATRRAQQTARQIHLLVQEMAYPGTQRLTTEVAR